MAIEIVDFPIKNGGPFHSYVKVYQAGCLLRRFLIWKDAIKREF